MKICNQTDLTTNVNFTLFRLQVVAARLPKKKSEHKIRKDSRPLHTSFEHRPHIMFT
jgi:hypothetical protein